MIILIFTSVNFYVSFLPTCLGGEPCCAVVLLPRGAGFTTEVVLVFYLMNKIPPRGLCQTSSFTFLMHTTCWCGFWLNYLFLIYWTTNNFSNIVIIIFINYLVSGRVLVLRPWCLTCFLAPSASWVAPPGVSAPAAHLHNNNNRRVDIYIKARITGFPPKIIRIGHLQLETFKSECHQTKRDNTSEKL